MTSTAGFYQITASNMSFTPKSYDADLPSGLGLAVSTSTGKITGTPKWPGLYDIPIYATNPGGTGTGTVHFTVTPNGPAPVVSSAATVNCTAFVAMPTYTITASNSPTLYDAAPLPPGLSRSTSTGNITGTPTVVGSTVVTVSATGIGGTGTKAVTFNVAANPNGPNITASSFSITGNVGVAISPVTIATSPVATAVSISPLLPGGLMLNATTGVISGTPTATVTNGSYTITASNSVGSDTAPLTINIAAAITPPVMSGPINGVGAVGTAIKSLQFTSTNSPTFTATGLPGGVTISSAGLVSGTPTATGTFNATITATNGSGSDTQGLSMVISASGTDINLAMNGTTLTSSDHTSTNVGPKAVDGVIADTSRWESNYSDPQWIEIDLGAAKTIHSVVITWQSAAGKDYRIETSATSGGVDGSGGTWTNFVTPIVGNVTYGVANPLTYTGSVSARYLRIYCTLRRTQYGCSPDEIQIFGPASGGGGSAPVINSPASATGTVGTPFTYTITATNSPTSYNATGTLPPGLSFSGSTISGTPTTAGTYSGITISATNGSGSDSDPLTITINSSGGGDTNLALNQPATASSFQAGNIEANANDASTTSRWASVDGTFPQWWRVDLGANKVLSRVDIMWLNPTTRAYKYKLEVSTDDATYNTAFDNTGNTTIGNSSDTISATARYVRVTVTGSTTGGFASFFDIQVLGH
jgi:hypothetical protein